MYNTTEVKFGPLLGAGSLIGLGMGSFIDGILMHQIFQLHNMISARLPVNTLEHLQQNLFWEGVFHLFSWLIILFGFIQLWRAMLNPYTPKSSRALVGSFVLGCGLFYCIEGFVNHFLLKVHHAVEQTGRTEEILWDISYIIGGLALSVMGKVLISQGKRLFYMREIDHARNRDYRFKPAFGRRRRMLA